MIQPARSPRPIATNARETSSSPRRSKALHQNSSRQHPVSGTAGKTSGTVQKWQALVDASARVAQLQRLGDLSPGSQQDQPKTLPHGLPDGLRHGIETLSGLAMDHVRVHHNSPKPAQLSAHAYAQGNEIHLAPGQDQHLPHEAWHLVQQAQGRVRPTLALHDGVAINNDHGLEREADRMGAQALRMGERANQGKQNFAIRSNLESKPITQEKLKPQEAQ